MSTEGKTIPLADLFPDQKPGSQAAGPKRTRQPKGTQERTIDKATFKEMFELASAGLKLGGEVGGQLALTPDEIDNMAEAWYRIAKEYPAFGKTVTKGRKASVWGNLLIVNVMILGKRVDVVADWWKDRPKKPARPQPVRTMQRPTAVVRPAPQPSAEDAAWGPSSPDATGAVVP